MLETTLVRLFHFLGIFLVISSVVLELFLVKKQLSRKEINKLNKVDGLYGLGSIIIVGTGLLLWLVVGKDSSYYSSGWLIYAKLITFSVVGALSIIPTVWFFKHKKGNQEEIVLVPDRVKKIIVIELLLLLLMPVFATFMAGGY